MSPIDPRDVRDKLITQRGPVKLPPTLVVDGSGPDLPAPARRGRTSSSEEETGRW